MKKIVSGILITALALGISTGVMANTNSNGEGTFNFGQMLPFMKQHHPDLSDKELKEMYESCHGTNGAAPSKNFQGMNNI